APPLHAAEAPDPRAAAAGGSPLVEAVKSGNRDAALALVAQRVAVHAPQPHHAADAPAPLWPAAGASPLVEAVKSGNRDAALALVAQRVDVNAPEPDGTNALHWAVQRNDLELGARLIRAGA